MDDKEKLAKMIYACEKKNVSRAYVRCLAFAHELNLQATLRARVKGMNNVEVSHGWLKHVDAALSNGQSGGKNNIWYKVSENLPVGSAAYLSCCEMTKKIINSGGEVVVASYRLSEDYMHWRFFSLVEHGGKILKKDVPPPEEFMRKGGVDFCSLTLGGAEDFYSKEAVRFLKECTRDDLVGLLASRVFLNTMGSGVVDLDGVCFYEGKLCLVEIKRKTPMLGKYILKLPLSKDKYTHPLEALFHKYDEVRALRSLENAKGDVSYPHAKNVMLSETDLSEATVSEISELKDEVSGLRMESSGEGLYRFNGLFGLDVSHVKSLLWAVQNDVSYLYVIINYSGKKVVYRANPKKTKEHVVDEKNKQPSDYYDSCGRVLDNVDVVYKFPSHHLKIDAEKIFVTYTLNDHSGIYSGKPRLQLVV